MQDPLPHFDALILAGGRSSRLGGVPKQHLLFRGATLLERSLDAASGARRTVVVGPDPGRLPETVLSCREQPEFSGPAAAIAAGLEVLSRGGGEAEYTLVLACDMPLVADAVVRLSSALSAEPADGPGKPDVVMAATDDGTPHGRAQPLAGFYRTAGLKNAVQDLAARGALINGSVRSLLASLDVQLVTVPAAATADVDTWDDAAALGIAAGHQDDDQGRRSRSQLGRQFMKSQEETLEEWCRSLLQAYELEDVQVDVNAILSLAGVAAHSVVRPAAPLTTFIAGYAAGLASGAGRATDAASMDSALAVARSLAADYDAEAAGTPGE